MIGSIGNVSEQAAAALSVLLYVGPVAVYAMWLGLVNSQAAPKVITARDDFVIMTVAFCPFVVAPVVGLVHAGYGWASVAAAGLMLLLFLRLLPAKDSGWVIHNLSPRRARTLIDRTLRSLGWSYRWSGRTAIVAERDLSVEIGSVWPLRSVALHVRRTGADQPASDLEALQTGLCCRLRRDGGLPSVAGCCLLMGGVCLLILPLWMLSRHSAAIAEVVTRILLS